MRHLKLNDRIRIKSLQKRNIPVSSIAEKIGVCRQTIYSELARGTRNGTYDPYYAESLYQQGQRSKGRPPILRSNIELAQRISTMILIDHRSPEQIIQILKDDFSEEKDIPFSVNTIYSAIDNGLIPGVTRESLRSNDAKMFSGGMLCVPKWAREKYHFNDGDFFTLDIQEDGTIIFRKKHN